MEKALVAGQHRNIKSSVTKQANSRRKQLAVGFAKENRDSLLRAKRLRRAAPEDGEGGMGMDEGSWNAEVSKEVLEAQLEAAVKQLRHAIEGPSKGSTKGKTEALRELRRLLSNGEEPPVALAVHLGVVPLLVNCLGFGLPEEQLVEAAWCLSNIAGGDRNASMAALPAAALLISLLGEYCPLRVAEHAVWGLSNLAAEGSEATAVLLAQGILPALTGLLLAAVADPAKLELGKTVAWALSNVLKSSEVRTVAEFVRSEKVPEAIVKMLTSGPAAVASEAAWISAYITAKSEPSSDALLAAGIAEPLLTWAYSANEAAVLTPVIRTLGNLAAMDDKKTDAILGAGASCPGGAMEAFSRCLACPHRSVQKETCWLLSNIAGGSPAHKLAVLQSAIWQRLTGLLKTAAFDIRKEAAFALGNLCVDQPSGQSGSQGIQKVNLEVLTLLVQEDCLSGFLTMVKSADPEAVRLGLQFTEMVLRVLPGKQGVMLVEEGDGIDALESLQFHENDELRLMANMLVDKYFGVDYDVGAM